MFALDQIEEIYKVNPYDKLTISRRPSHRDKANKHIDMAEVYMDSRGKKGREPLAVTRPDGSRFYNQPSVLSFTIFPEGAVRSVLLPFYFKREFKFC